MHFVTQKQILLRFHTSTASCGIIKVGVVINFTDQVEFTDLFL